MRNRPILYIDDDARSRELVIAILTDADFEVRSAPDGPSGIELAHKARPAVIILDMMMPDMDGIITLQHLKRDPLLKDIPVVGITASSDLSYTEKAFRAGAQFVLPKPFRAASLLRVVELAADSAHRDAPMRRRRRPRHPADVPVCCSVQGNKDTPSEVTGKTGNVSLGGLLLLLPQTLAPGMPLQLGLGLPEAPITAKGTVMWQHSERRDEGNVPHGVRLLGFMEDAGLLRYRRYLSTMGGPATA